MFQSFHPPFKLQQMLQILSIELHIYGEKLHKTRAQKSAKKYVVSCALAHIKMSIK